MGSLCSQLVATERLKMLYLFSVKERISVKERTSTSNLIVNVKRQPLSVGVQILRKKKRKEKKEGKKNFTIIQHLSQSLLSSKW